MHSFSLFLADFSNDADNSKKNDNKQNDGFYGNVKLVVPLGRKIESETETISMSWDISIIGRKD